MLQPSPFPQPSILHTNEFIRTGTGQYLSSMDGQFHALLTTNAELKIVWGTPANGSVISTAYGGQPTRPYALQMMDDGRLGIFNVKDNKPSGDPLWSSSAPAGKAEYFANMQTDGNLVVYRGTGPSQPHTFVWATGSVVRLASDNVGLQSGVTASGTALSLSTRKPSTIYPPDHGVSVQATNASDLMQRWQKWERLQYDSLVGWAFLSRTTSRFLSGKGNQGSMSVTTDNRADLIWWRPSFTAPGPSGICALSPVGNDGLVLNVYGNEPYIKGNKVGLWGSTNLLEPVNSLWQFDR